LAWIPVVKPDADGTAEVEFYTADFPSVYDIVIEGVTSNGLPCHSQHSIRRE